MLANNRISRITKDFAQLCPKLETVVLQSNRLQLLSELDNLPGTLKRLVCLDNVVANLPNYRLYVIYKFPLLKMLDYQKISEQERTEAHNLFSVKGNLEKVLTQDKAHANMMLNL